jgi:acetyl esterase/lipase
MLSIKPDPQIETKKVTIPTKDGKRMPALLLCKKGSTSKNRTGILWIHGGGYILGLKEMIYMSRAIDLIKKFDCVVLSPGYRLAFQKPYPAAIEDCYDALLFFTKHAADFGVRTDQIMAGGESAGGGLCAALCLMARDKKEVNIAFQMPLYPMLDYRDTPSSANNHGKVWNTKRNHFAWKQYLKHTPPEKIDAYASPALAKDYVNLPPCYTFVGNGEPFYDETLAYISKLKEAGVPARADVYESDMHAFDMMKPDSLLAKQAVATFNQAFAYAQKHYFAPQSKEENEYEL